MPIIAEMRSNFGTFTMTSRSFRIILIGSAAFVIAAVIVAGTLTLGVSVDAPTPVFIARGTSLSAAIDSVDRHAPLPTPALAKIAVRAIARVTQRSVQAGWYMIQPGDSQWDIIIGVLSGSRRPHERVTIPEGLNYREIAALLARKAEIDSAAFVSWCESDSVIQQFAPNAPSMEGYLMPETYDVLWRDDATSVATMMARHAQRTWKGLRTTEDRHRILTLASIVQSEAASLPEMPRIAGVYANRLRIGMRLEADPTVQYGLGAKRRVLYRDLDAAHAFNTYINAGLPPGPIANPGKAAMQAALKPESHSFLFFVARGDGSGTHRFSTNGAEHVKNVAMYRRERSRQR